MLSSNGVKSTRLFHAGMGSPGAITMNRNNVLNFSAESDNTVKSIWIGVGAVIVAIALPAIVLSASRSRQESRAIAAIDQVFISCPVECDAWLRSNYEEQVHDWALQLTRKIVADRGGRRFDLSLYKRLVLSALADRAEAVGLEDTELAMKLAASGIDVSLKKNWRELADQVDPEVEGLFLTPILEQTDDEGEIVSVGKAAPPDTPALIAAIAKQKSQQEEVSKPDDAEADSPESGEGEAEEEPDGEMEEEPEIEEESGMDSELEMDAEIDPGLETKDEPEMDTEIDAAFETEEDGPEMEEENSGFESADEPNPQREERFESDSELEPEMDQFSEAREGSFENGGDERASGSRSNALAVITPPVTVRAQPIRGSGESRRAELQVTNNGDQAITKLVVGITLYKEDGSVQKTVPHSCDGAFGKNGKKLGKGRNHEIELTDFRIKDDTAAVAGTVKEITWEDGTQWPAWTGPPEEPQEGDPVSLVCKGVLGADSRGWGLPLIEAFNHSDREVRGVYYRVRFLDGEGNELANKRWGERRYSFGPGEGIAMVGFEAPPEGTEDIEVSLEEVSYRDDPGVATHAPLTAEQINGREDVKGGNWTVSFEEECYLGFFLTETAKDGTRKLTFHWDAEPAMRHAFHYDHHEHKGDHELNFSPVRSEQGDADGGTVTFRFSDPEYGSGQQWQISDLEFNPAARRMGRGVFGPVSLYSWEASFSRMSYDVKAVFAKDPAAAEKSLESVFGNR